MKISKILIGIDDSKYAEHAAEYGFDLARTFNAAVGLVNIVEPTTIISEANVGVDPLMSAGMAGTGAEDMEILDIQKTQAKNIVDHAIKQFAGDMQVTHFTEYGSTANGIITCAKEFGADLIIIGTHSRTGFDRFLNGSVAEDVVRYSEIPVLVVPFFEK